MFLNLEPQISSFTYTTNHEGIIKRELTNSSLAERYKSIKNPSSTNVSKINQIASEIFIYIRLLFIEKTPEYKQNNPTESNIAPRLYHWTFRVAELAGGNYTTVQGLRIIKKSLDKDNERFKNYGIVQEKLTQAQKEKLIDSFKRTIEKSRDIITDDQLQQIAETFAASSDSDKETMKKDLADALNNSASYMRRVNAKLTEIQKNLHLLQRPPQLIKKWHETHETLCNELLNLQNQINTLGEEKNNLTNKLEKLKENHIKIIRDEAWDARKKLIIKAKPEFNPLKTEIKKINEEIKNLHKKLKETDFNYQKAINYPEYLLILAQQQKTNEDTIKNLRSEFINISKPFTLVSDDKIKEKASNLEKNCLPVFLTNKTLPASIPLLKRLETLQKGIENKCAQLILSSLEGLQSVQGAPRDGGSFYDIFLKTAQNSLQQAPPVNTPIKTILDENLLKKGFEDPAAKDAINAISTTLESYMQQEKEKSQALKPHQNLIPTH
jgi:hypothetical protein